MFMKTVYPKGISESGISFADLLIGHCIERASNLVDAIKDADKMFQMSGLAQYTVSIHELSNGMPEIRVTDRIKH